MVIFGVLHNEFSQEVVQRHCLPKNTEDDGGVLMILIHFNVPNWR